MGSVGLHQDGGRQFSSNWVMVDVLRPIFSFEHKVSKMCSTPRYELRHLGDIVDAILRGSRRGIDAHS